MTVIFEEFDELNTPKYMEANGRAYYHNSPGKKRQLSDVLIDPAV